MGNELGPLLRELRGDRTVEDVAHELGVVRAAVYFWESTTATRRLPSPEYLHRLLDLYGATPEQRLRVWELRSTASSRSSLVATETPA